MKRVVISGYYGFHNAGDEAILEGMLSAMREEAALVGEEIEFTVLSALPAQTAARHQVGAIGRMNIGQIIKALFFCNLFISGGGGLLQDSTGRSLSVLYYLGLVMLARMFGKPAVLYAQGIGPVRKPFSRMLMRLIANRATYISVRDTASLEELKKMGVTRPPIELTADPAFLLQPKVVSERPVFMQKKPVIGVAVRAWEGQNRYLQEIARAVDALAQEFSAHLVLIPMYYGEDLPVTNELAGMIKHDLTVLEEYLEPSRLLDIFAELDLVLSVRLHALIFAAIAGVPLVGIGYDPKVDAFLRQLDLSSAGNTNEVRADDLIRQGRERFLGRENEQMKLAEKREQLRLLARRTACKVVATLFESGEKP